MERLYSAFRLHNFMPGRASSSWPNALVPLGSRHDGETGKSDDYWNGLVHLETKAKVLRNFWETSTVALDLGALPSLDTDLVVVSHSLGEVERQGWVERLRQDVPTMLIVKMNDHDLGPHAQADATVDEMHGPGALVSTIYGLLTERGLGSRPWGDENASLWVQ